MTASLFLSSENVAARDFNFPRDTGWFHFHVLETGDIYEDGEDVLRGEYDLTAEYVSAIDYGMSYLDTVLHPGVADDRPVSVLMETINLPDENTYAFSPFCEDEVLEGKTTLALQLIDDIWIYGLDYVVQIQLDKPTSLGWNYGPVYSLPENGMTSSLSSAFPHEFFHALGMTSYSTYENGVNFFPDTILTVWSSHLRDINGNPPFPGQRIIPADEVCPDDSCFLTLPKDESGALSHWAGAYFTGDQVQQVLNGAMILPPSEASEAYRIAVPGIPVNLWEKHTLDDGTPYYYAELSHIELQNSMLSHQNYRNWEIYMEAELAILQDLGYTIDRRNFYGSSLYNSGLTVNNDKPFFARKNGAYVTGKPNTTPWGIGLHIYGSDNVVTQSADLLADGFSGIGVRADGLEGNTLTIAPTTTVTANGEHGYGVLFTYGKGHTLVLRGKVEATGDRGRAVAFDFGDNSLGNHLEYRGSYIRATTKVDYELILFSELQGALIASADITGSVKGANAAVYIGPAAWVQNINIMKGASIKGNIVSDWKPFTLRDQGTLHGTAPAPETLMTNLTFGFAPNENGVKTAALDPAFDMTVNGNIIGPESLDMSLQGGKLAVTGNIDVHSLTTNAGTVLTLMLSDAAKTTAVVRADAIDIAGTLSYTFDPALSGLNAGDILSVLDAGDTLTWEETNESFSLDSIFDYYQFDYVYNQTEGTLGLKVSSAQSKAAGAQSSAQMTASVVNVIGNKIMGRLNAFSGSVKGQSGGDTFREAGLWGKALYTHAHKSGGNAFKADIFSGVIGADGKVSDALTIGVASACSQTNGKAGKTGTDAKTYAGYLYGRYEQTNGRAYNLAAGYGVARFNVDNAPEFNVRFINVQGYADQDLGKGFVAEGGLRYIFTRQDEYTAGTTTFKAEETDTLTGILGGGYAYESGRFGVQARLAAIYDFISDKASFRATNRGISMYVNGERLHRFGGEAGVSATMRTNAWTFELGYDAQVRKDYNDQTISLKADHRF